MWSMFKYTITHQFRSRGELRDRQRTELSDCTAERGRHGRAKRPLYTHDKCCIAIFVMFICNIIPHTPTRLTKKNTPRHYAKFKSWRGRANSQTACPWQTGCSVFALHAISNHFCSKCLRLCTTLQYHPTYTRDYPCTDTIGALKVQKETFWTRNCYCFYLTFYKPKNHVKNVRNWLPRPRRFRVCFQIALKFLYQECDTATQDSQECHYLSLT